MGDNCLAMSLCISLSDVRTARDRIVDQLYATPCLHSRTLSTLTEYKRVDLAIHACNAARRPLTVIGDGPDRPRLQALAGPTIRFVGRSM